MLKIVFSFVAGVYVAQQFPHQVPDTTKIINGIKQDVLKKVDEYSKK